MNALTKDLLIAVNRKQVDKLRLLLSQGAPVNTADEDGFTPLHFACMGGDIDIVTLLLDHKADKFAVTNAEATAMTLAVVNGHGRIVEMLATRGLHPDHFGKDTHRHPLIHAMPMASDAMAHKLISLGASLDIIDTEKMPLIALAAQYNHTAIIEAALPFGHLKTAMGFAVDAALALAVENFQTESIDLLLREGADPNAPAYLRPGNTVLQRMCINQPNEDKLEKSIKIIRLLLEHGASPNISRRQDADSPNETAKKSNNQHAQHMLEHAEYIRQEFLDRPKIAAALRQNAIDVAHTGTRARTTLQKPIVICRKPS